MKLEPGRTLAHYRLIEPIGRGGMGEVWRAADTTLDREVAIKLLPPEFSSDADRLARFEREAKVLASLNHPGIAQIYGFHREGEAHFLVMELVPGEDLGACLARGPLPLEEALSAARQVAEALEEAHEHGVVHRDLKPANVVLAAGGGAKVLDFGLAKVYGSGGAPRPSSDPSLSPTVTSLGTEAGVIMGTAAYMSPEQARGKAFDRRTDIWSFGCLLYEALTGRRAFRGETVSDTIAGILRSEPDWTALPEGTPRRLRELLERCLERDPRRRLRDIGDARVELERLGEDRAWERPGAPDAGPAPVRGRSGLLPAALLLLGLVSGAAGWSLLAPRSAPRALRVSVEAPAGYVPNHFRASPDGRSIVFEGRPDPSDPAAPERSRLFLRPLDEAEARPIPGTGGGHLPAFSPDGRWLAYVAPVKEGSEQRRVYKVALDGSSPPLGLVDWEAGWSDGMLWLDGERLLFSSQDPIELRIAKTGGEGVAGTVPVELGEPGSELVLHDRLPDGVHVLASSFTWDDRGYHDRIFTVNTETGEARKILDDGSHAAWSPTGHMLFSRDETLLALPFDPGRLQSTGGPVAVASGLRTAAGEASGEFHLSPGGTLVHQSGGRVGSRRRIVILEEDGTLTPWSDDRLSFVGELQVSPDGRHLSVTVMTPDDLLYSVWISQVDRPGLRQFLAMPRLDCTDARWHSGGDLVTMCEGNTEAAGVYQVPLDRSTAPRRLYEARGGFSTLRSVHPGGGYLLVQERGSDGTFALLVPVQETGGPFQGRPLFPDGRPASGVSFSPDGRLISWVSVESGRAEALVAPFQEGGRVGPSTLVANSDSVWWIETGTPGVHDLVYKADDLRSEAVRIRTDPFSIGEPRPFLDLSDHRPQIVDYTDHPDGRILAIQGDEQEGGNRRLDLILHFDADLRRLTP